MPPLKAPGAVVYPVIPGAGVRDWNKPLIPRSNPLAQPLAYPF